MGSRCGSVGSTITSYTRDPRFESSNRQVLFTINCIEKTKIKIKRPGRAQLKKENKLLFIDKGANRCVWQVLIFLKLLAMRRKNMWSGRMIRHQNWFYRDR